MTAAGLTFLGRTLPPGFRLRVLPLWPGTQRRYVAEEWEDSIVVVERGDLELECTAGGFRSFRCGAVISLAGLGLRALHNRGGEPVLLSVVTRDRSEKMQP